MQIQNLLASDRKEFNFISMKSNCYLYLVPERGIIRLRGHSHAISMAKEAIDQTDVDRVSLIIF